jgi:cobalt/nickel transport system permease protein
MTLDWLGHLHSRRDSPIHRLPAALKLGAALAAILGTVLAPTGWTAWYVGVSLALGGAVVLSRTPVRFLLKRLAVMFPFVLGVALVNAFQPGAKAGWLAVLVRSTLCLATVILLSNTTPFSGILRVLRRVGVPGLLITTLTLMHRYLFVMADEAERMRRARASRTFQRRRGIQWRLLATVVSQLFVRASERAERIYAAMCARGWR